MVKEVLKNDKVIIDWVVSDFIIAEFNKKSKNDLFVILLYISIQN